MTADKKIEPTGLALLMVPFEANEVGKLPKPTKAQTDAVKADFKAGGRCDVCGGWHHPKVVHLDYIGHAALTKRLLQADPHWTWEPMALAPDGTPLMDKNGGMWIRLTVCGVTRLGYGFADGKSGGDAIKETIGDCLVTGTLITTSRGDVPIEAVRIGDLVPTREGWRTVIDHWRSSPSAPVLMVRLSNGRSITGTPHHKVPTGDGEKRLSALRAGDTMHGWLDTESFPTQNKPNGVDGDIVATHCINPSIAAGTSWLRPTQEPTCTAISTNPWGVKYPPVGTFITRMRTGTTIALTTLSRLLLASMRPFTRHPGLTSSGFAMNVAGHLPASSIALAGVLPHVRSDAGVAMAWRMFGLARQPHREICNAKNVGNNLGRQSHGVAFAPVAVVEVSDAGRGEVWNLSVDGVHEYVANGILVNNCLRNAAMRFGAALELWHKGDLYDEDELRSMGVEIAAPPTGRTKETKPPVTKPEITPEEKQRLAKFTVWFLDQVAKATTGDAIDRGCASRAADFESLKVASPADYNKIMEAISARHDMLRFPPDEAV